MIREYVLACVLFVIPIIGGGLCWGTPLRQHEALKLPLCECGEDCRCDPCVCQLPSAKHCEHAYSRCVADIELWNKAYDDGCFGEEYPRAAFVELERRRNAWMALWWLVWDAPVYPVNQAHWQKEARRHIGCENYDYARWHTITPWGWKEGRHYLKSRK